MKALFFFILSALFLPSNGQVVRLSAPSQTKNVDYAHYLEDPEASFSLEQVQKAQNRFIKPKDRVPDFLGSTAKAIWYKLEVRNEGPEENWFLEIKGGFMHQMTVYQISADNTIQTLTLNADNSFDKRAIRSNNLLFPVHLSPRTGKTIYVRATSKTLIRTSMSFNTMQTLYEKSVFVSYADGFFTAIAVALLLYNLFVYFTLKEKVYLYYIGYISTAIIHTNLVSGHVQAFTPMLDWLNTTTILPVVSFFSILFTNSFLHTRKYAPFIYKVGWLLIAYCIAPLSCYVAGWYGPALLLVSILVFTLFIYWIIAGIVVLRKGFQPAIFYLIGFGALAVMSVIFEMKMKGVLPETYWTDSSLLVGAAIEATVLSFALASQINFYKKEKEQIQAESYQQAINFSRDLIHMQEIERKRIASELHDSLGQKLILIKNKILKTTLQAKPAVPQDESLSAIVAEAIQEIRSISYGLRPYQIDLLGLTSSINSLVDENLDVANIDFTTTFDNIDGTFDNDANINIYRIIQECVNNIVKHSNVTHADFIISKKSDAITISIKDNGSGFDTSVSHSGFGLKGIRERLHILNGLVTINSLPTLGTSFQFYIPVSTHHP